MNVSLSIERIRRWGMKGGLAIIDQGLFSGTNFVLNILLARWLLPDEYGAFTISLTVYLFFTGFYIALVLEPASVIGPSKHANDLGSYLKDLFKLHFILCFILSILVVGTGFVLLSANKGNTLLANALFGNGISLTFILFFWLVRRSFYIFQRPEYALSGSVIFSLVSIVGMYTTFLLNIISVFGVFLIIGLASLLGSILLLWTGRAFFVDGRSDKRTWRETLSEQWRFGKWRTLGSFLAISFGQIQTFIVAGMLSLSAVGVLRALQNLILPMIQIETVIESLGLSNVSSEYGLGNVKAVKEKSFLIAFILLCISIVYAAFLLFSAEHLDRLLYFNKYTDYIELVPLLSISPILLALAMGFALPILSMGKSQYYIIVYSINAPISIFFAFLLTQHFGLTGAVISTLIAPIINIIVAVVLYFLWFPR